MYSKTQLQSQIFCMNLLWSVQICHFDRTLLAVVILKHLVSFMPLKLWELIILISLFYVRQINIISKKRKKSRIKWSNQVKQHLVT